MVGVVRNGANDRSLLRACVAVGRQSGSPPRLQHACSCLSFRFCAGVERETNLHADVHFEVEGAFVLFLVRHLSSFTVHVKCFVLKQGLML